MSLISTLHPYRPHPRTIVILRIILLPLQVGRWLLFIICRLIRCLDSSTQINHLYIIPSSSSSSSLPRPLPPFLPPFLPSSLSPSLPPFPFASPSGSSYTYTVPNLNQTSADHPAFIVMIVAAIRERYESRSDHPGILSYVDACCLVCVEVGFGTELTYLEQ